MLDGLSEIESDPARKARRSGNASTHRAIRDGVSDATSVPELTDLSKEPEGRYQAVRRDARKGGTFANTCLMARRLVERGVRFVQIYSAAGTSTATCPKSLPSQCKDVDQACYGAGQDLKAAGYAQRHARRSGAASSAVLSIPGQADRHRLRPRSSSALLHASGWQAAALRAASYTGRRTSSLQHRQGSGPCPRLPGDNAAPVRHRSTNASLTSIRASIRS